MRKSSRLSRSLILAGVLAVAPAAFADETVVAPGGGVINETDTSVVVVPGVGVYSNTIAAAPAARRVMVIGEKADEPEIEPQAEPKIAQAEVPAP